MLSIAEQAIIKGVTAVCCMRNSFLRRRRRSTPQPLTGEPSNGPQKPPLQGEVAAPQGADGGVHCRLAAEISCKARQDLAPCPQGTMLASSRKPCAAARSRGGRERPPYNTRQTGGKTGNGRPPAPAQGAIPHRPTVGPDVRLLILCCRPPTGTM